MDRSEMHPDAGDLGHTFEALLQELERVRAELIGHAREGNAWAYAALYDRHHGAVYH